MSLKLHVFWRTITFLFVFLASWCLLWGGYYEIAVWHKSLFQAVMESWWNWLILAVCIVGVSFTSYIDDLIDEKHD